MSHPQSSRKEFHVALAELREQIQGPAPRLVYHYTTADGLKGIVTNNTVWASNVSHLNDARELRHGSELIGRVLRSRIDAAPKRGRWRQVLEGTQAVLEEVDHLRGLVYAVSFSSEGDSLGQWRGYASMGGGYSLGFLPSRFKTKESPVPTLRRVFYSRKEQEGILAKVFALALKHLPVGRRSTDTVNALGAMAHDIGMELFQYVSSFKDPSFAEEKEWRLVCVLPPKLLTDRVCFRSSSTGLKPYIEVPLTSQNRRLPIRIVRHGPTLSPELARHSTHLLLEQQAYNLKTIQVCSSEVPYRP